MKKLLAFATALIFVSSAIVQAQGGKYMYTAEYTLNFSDKVTIKIGGAKQDKTSEEWENGGKVGKHTIDGKTFKELQANTANKYKIEIEKKKIGTLHGMRVTDLESGKIVKGIYNDKDKKFTFGTAKSQKQGDASKTDVGIVKGQFGKNMTIIQNGQYGVGFIAGKGAVIVTASATFYFDATQPEQ